MGFFYLKQGENIIQSGETQITEFSVDFPSNYTDAPIEYTVEFIDDDNVLVSCIWDKIAEIQELDPTMTWIIVPFGVTAISTDAFSLECPERCISSISEIALPATLKKLYDGAFSGIRDLSVL